LKVTGRDSNGRRKGAIKIRKSFGGSGGGAIHIHMGGRFMGGGERVLDVARQG